MEKNIGSVERVIRIILGLVLIAWGIYAQNWIGAIGLVPLVTGLVSWCPAWMVFGINTSSTKEKEES